MMADGDAMKMPKRVLFLAVLLSLGGVAGAQAYPAPTPAQQAGIDKDTSRHFGDAPADPGPLATDLSPAISAPAIDKATRKVADWQLARSQPYFDRIWTWSVLYSGFMAASDVDRRSEVSRCDGGDGEEATTGSCAAGCPNADDQSLAQTYLELYLRAGKNADRQDDRAVPAPISIP